MNLDIEQEMQSLEDRKKKLIALRELRAEVSVLERDNMGMSLYSGLVSFVSTVVAADLKLRFADMVGTCRRRDLSEARWIVFYLCRKISKDELPFETIGRLMRRDHGTVMYGIARLKETMETDKGFEKRVLMIEQACQQKWEANVQGNIHHLNQGAAA